MIALEYVFPGHATEADFRWLEISDNAGPEYHKIPLLQIDHLLKQKKLHLFRYKKGEGVVLVEVITGALGHKRLNILRTAGKGVLLNFGEVLRVLQHTAQEWGCQQIETMVYSVKLAKALRRIGANPEAVNMVVEVPNGQ